MLLYFVLFWKNSSATKVQSERKKKSFDLRQPYSWTIMKFTPPSSPRHSSLPNLFHQGIGLNCSFEKKKRPDQSWVDLSPQWIHTPASQLVPTSLGRTAEKRPHPHYLLCVTAGEHRLPPLVSIVYVVVKHRMVPHCHRGNARHCLGHTVSPRGAHAEFCDSWQKEKSERAPCLNEEK